MVLSFIDYIIIAVYIAVLAGIGIYFKRRSSSSLEDYFLGGRSLPWWMLGLAGMASWLDMTGTMLITSFLYLLGPRGLYIEFRGGAGLILVFMMLWTGKWHRRSGVITGAEWMKFRFGGGVWGNCARLSSVVATIVLTVGLLAYVFKGAGLFLSMFLPFSPFACALGMVAVTATYTITAGFYGLVIADVIQAGCDILATIAIVVLVIVKITGTNLAAVALSVTGNSDWVTTLPQWQTSMPPGYENYSLLTMVAGFYLLKVFLQGTGSSGMDPKYFGARSDRECGLLSFTQGWFLMARWPLMLGFAVLGLYLVRDLFPDQSVLVQAADLIKLHIGDASKNTWPELTAGLMNHPADYPAALVSGLQQILGTDWMSKLSLLSYEGTVNPERILPAVILASLPVGIRGLLITALAGAAVATSSALLNKATGFLSRDLYQGYIRPHAGRRELISVTYAFSLVMFVISMLVAYRVESLNDIWGWISMGLLGGMGIPNLLRLYWWRFNSCGYTLGMVCGVGGAVLQRVFIPHMPEVNQFLFMGAIGLIGSIAGTYFSKPTDPDVLKNFYCKTRPFGFWGPLKSALSQPDAAAMSKEHFYDLISVPFALAWMVTLLLIPMQLLIGQYRDCIFTSIVFAVALIGLYFFWYKKLPHDPKFTNPPEENEGGRPPCLGGNLKIFTTES
ncbi:MAG: hypothetical protein WCG03_09880 [Kiritimatiellales bacterium]